MVAFTALSLCLASLCTAAVVPQIQRGVAPAGYQLSDGGSPAGSSGGVRNSSTAGAAVDSSLAANGTDFAARSMLNYTVPSNTSSVSNATLSAIPASTPTATPTPSMSGNGSDIVRTRLPDRTTPTPTPMPTPTPAQVQLPASVPTPAPTPTATAASSAGSAAADDTTQPLQCDVREGVVCELSGKVQTILSAADLVRSAGRADYFGEPPSDGCPNPYDGSLSGSGSGSATGIAADGASGGEARFFRNRITYTLDDADETDITIHLAGWTMSVVQREGGEFTTDLSLRINLCHIKPTGDILSGCSCA